ncbi:MAG: AIR synthase related protein [bacterium]
MKRKSEYAQAGVDYSMLEPFKQIMIEMGKKTLDFPNRRGVYIDENIIHSHGAVYEYRKQRPKKMFGWVDYYFGGQPIWCKTQEGLGNKNWIAEWMYQFSGAGNTYYHGIAIDAALMAVNDLIAQGAMPVIYTDEVATGDSEWFEDKVRANDLAQGFYDACQMCGMALPAGESPALKYLIKATEPVKSAPSLSGCATGIIWPRSRLITGKELNVGDVIIGASSSGIHANGISLIIKRAMSLKDQFLTKLPSGAIFGEEALTPTKSYVELVEKLLEAEINIHAFLPGTGDGLGKIAFDKRRFTYWIFKWPEVPEIFLFMKELGVSMEDCLKTFNWGVGYYIFVSPTDINRVMDIGEKAGYQLTLLGRVEEGQRKVVFEPENTILPPPGE